MGKDVRLIHMELGPSTDDEVCHLDHMSSQEEWQDLAGDQDTFDGADVRISEVVSQKLRHGTCYRRFAMSALGYAPRVEVYNSVRDSRANADRTRDFGNQSGVTPRSLIVIGARDKGTEDWNHGR